jgi:hypothetical protein
LVKAEISGLARKVCLTEEDVVTYENQSHERETGKDNVDIFKYSLKSVEIVFLIFLYR